MAYCKKADNRVPPDGGYGWVVTFAYALNNVVVLPLIAGFPLIFQEAFDYTNLTSTQGTLVITLNHAIGMLLTLFGGPLLRCLGYRKVAVIGALFISFGVILTSFANNFWFFIVSYSIINSMGVAAVMAAFNLAINSFFKEKRGRAIGIGMSLTGIGAIYMPLLMSALMKAYGWRYTVLILGAVCLHSLVASCLLRPAKWYFIKQPLTQEMVPLKQEKETPNCQENMGQKDHNVGQNQKQILKCLSMVSLSDNSSNVTRCTVSQPNLNTSHTKSDETIKLISNDGKTVEIIQNNTDKEKKSGCLDKVVEFFDLTLLKDPIFVNILFGLSLASCVETNFSLLLPLILNNMYMFQTQEIARLMAIIGFYDTLFRFVSPFIGERCRKSPRVMYILSLVLIIVIRTIMLFTTTFSSMVFVASAIGVTKGVRTVYMNIVIPSYVPIERLPYASGLQMFCNGIIITTIGSLLGRMRETSGSYRTPIIVLNFMTALAIISWCAEFLYFRMKTKIAKIQSTDMNA